MADLLFLTQRIPYPPIKGEKIRPLQILRHLGRHFDVHLGCLIDDPRDWAHVETVRALCKDACFVPLDRRRAMLGLVSGLLAGEPLSVTFFKNRELARWVNRVLDTVRPEALFICSGNMAPYVLNHPHKGRVRLVDLADVDSEKWRAYAERSRFPMRWVHAREMRQVKALEERIARETDYSTFVSEAEASLFRRLVPDCAGKILGVSSGVDFRYFDPAIGFEPPFDPAVPTYVFTGTMDYAPNIDAVEWFALEILPKITARLGRAQFFIVGSNPAPSVQKLSAIEGVTVTGRVADVRPYVAHATAAVAPMRVARGIQNKVLEGMAMARPVIVTSDGLEGIDAVPGGEVCLANTADEIAEAACALASGPDGAAMGEAARRKIVSTYDWPVQLAAFDRLLGVSELDSVPATARSVREEDRQVRRSQHVVGGAAQQALRET